MNWINDSLKSFLVTVNSNELKLSNPVVYKPPGKKLQIIESADYVYNTPATLNLPANSYWALAVKWSFVIGSIGNVFPSPYYGMWVQIPSFQAGKRIYLSLFDLTEYVPSIGSLVYSLNKIIPAEISNSIVFRYDGATDQVSLIIKPDGSNVILGKKLSLSLGLSSVASIVQAAACVFKTGLYRGPSNAANMDLLGSQFLHLQVDVVNPQIFGLKYKPVVATLCVSSLKAQNDSMYLQYTSNKATSFFHDLNINRVSRINFTWINENGDVIRFVKRDPSEVCFMLSLEFKKQIEWS